MKVTKFLGQGLQNPVTKIPCQGFHTPTTEWNPKTKPLIKLTT